MTTKISQYPSLFEVRYVDQAGGCERPHTHSSLIISAVSGGDLTLLINDTEMRLEQEKVAVVGPHTLHCIRAYSSTFKGVYVLEIFALPITCCKFKWAHFQLFKSQLLHDGQFYNYFTDLCLQLLSPLKRAQKTKLLFDWLNALLYSTYYSPVTRELSRYDYLAPKIRNILDTHEKETAPFDKISEVCGLSKERCNRIFRSLYNISIQGYFLNKKADHARTLLTSSQPLSDIALECGFYDQSHFNRIFKKIFQTSPAEYRSLIR